MNDTAQLLIGRIENRERSSKSRDFLRRFRQNAGSRVLVRTIG